MVQRWMAAALVPLLLLAGCDVEAEPDVTVTESAEPTEPEPAATEADPSPTATAAAAESQEAGEELPGDYAKIIGDETDCGELQAIFDVADNAAEGAREDGRLEGEYGAYAFTRVMGAADERMREVGCYD